MQQTQQSQQPALPGQGSSMAHYFQVEKVLDAIAEPVAVRDCISGVVQILEERSNQFKSNAVENMTCLLLQWQISGEYTSNSFDKRAPGAVQRDSLVSSHRKVMQTSSRLVLGLTRVEHISESGKAHKVAHQQATHSVGSTNKKLGMCPAGTHCTHAQHACCRWHEDHTAGFTWAVQAYTACCTQAAQPTER